VSVAEWLEAGAAVLTTSSFVPQALRVLRTRETGAISLAMYTLFTAGVACWGIYGTMTAQWSMVAANAITFCLASVILAMKVSAVASAARAPRAR
jgi:MtN3 and saliva related transmembrane protein